MAVTHIVPSVLQFLPCESALYDLLTKKMSNTNKFVSNHEVGRGVVFDCTEWAGESTEGWSRGKFVSNHEVGQGVHLPLELVPEMRLSLTFTLQPGADWNAIRTKLKELVPLLNEIDASIDGQGLRLDENTSNEMLLLELRATGELTVAQWRDIVTKLQLPEPAEDPAPGLEFAPTEELPPEHVENARQRMQAIFERTAAREAELKQNPPKPEERAQRGAQAAAKMLKLLKPLRDLGCHLETDLESDDPF
jgi:hypothetical protein